MMWNARESALAAGSCQRGDAERGLTGIKIEAGTMGGVRAIAHLRIVPRETKQMASIRAEAVAEVLWELKRLEKLATFTEVAERAGFKPGVNGKNLATCLDTIRRDWPHLQWWRAVSDDGRLAADCEQATFLKSAGYELSAAAGRKTILEIVGCDTHLISWKIVEESAPAAAIG